MDDIAFCPLHKMFPTKTGKIETIPQIIVILRGKSHYPWRFVSWLPGGVPVPLVYCPFRSWHLTTNAESLELLFSCLPSPLYHILHILDIIFISSISSKSFSYPLYRFRFLTTNAESLYISFSYPQDTLL